MDCPDPNIWRPNVSHLRVKEKSHSHKQFALTNTVLLVPVQFLSRWTYALVTALGVHTAVLAAPVADAALIDVCDATTKSAIHTQTYISKSKMSVSHIHFLSHDWHAGRAGNVSPFQR